MIAYEDTDSAEFVNANHRNFKGNNISVTVQFDDFDNCFDFKIGCRQLAVNPMASIAGDDRLQPCFQPLLSGWAKVVNDNQVTGKTDPVPKYLQDKRGLHDIKIGLMLVKHNLPKYSDYYFAHAPMF